MTAEYGLVGAVANESLIFLASLLWANLTEIFVYHKGTVMVTENRSVSLFRP
jgi:hypothetical protein